MKNSHLNRRETLALLGSGAAAVALESNPAAAQYGVRIREDIVTFATSPTKVAALRNGVRVMMNKSAANQDDPAGWYYWASSHGTANAVPPALSSIYNQCRHGSVHFLSWHRAFLYYFEQTLRTASGDATLNLPYWNWYTTPTIPSIFTTGDATTNSLFHVRANNTTSGLSQGPLNRINLLAPPVPGFSSDLEGNPHGTVHGELGGDMGFVNRSARDPIFWLHHCNIDRLWNVWINKGGGRTNPGSGDPWSNEQFVFNTAGTMKKSAGQVTNTVTMLNYKYDKETTPVIVVHWNWVLAAALIARPIPGGPGPGPEKPPMTMAQNKSVEVASSLSAGGLSLGTKSTQVTFTLSEKNRSRVMSFAAAPAGQSTPDLQDVDLVLEGVDFGSDGNAGGYSFLVCVGLPKDGASQAVLDRQCVGVLNSFSLSVQAKHEGHGDKDHAGPNTVRFALGPAVRGLDPKAIANGVPVTFIAQHEPLSKGKGEKSYITVKNAHLELSTVAGIRQ